MPRWTSPALADLSGLPPAVAAAPARGARGGAARAGFGCGSSGALCTAYHADLLFDAATPLLRPCRRARRATGAGDYARAHRHRAGRHAGAGRPSASHPPPVRRTSRPVWLRLGRRRVQGRDATTRLPRRGAARRRCRPLRSPMPAADGAPHVAGGLSWRRMRRSVWRASRCVRGDRRQCAADPRSASWRVSPGFGPRSACSATATARSDARPSAARAIYRAGRTPRLRAVRRSVRGCALARQSRNSTLCCAWPRRRRWR